MKQGGIVAAVIGGLLFLFGLIRFNSMESQLVRGFGGSDGLGMFLLVAGGILAVVGALTALSSPHTQAGVDEVTNNCPSCGGLNLLPGVTKCAYCGHALNKLAASDAVRTEAEVGKPAVNTIDQLERLTALRERGALSDDEFQQQKSKLLI